jgi:uncharacterized protein (TIGR03083 family)
MSTPAAPGFSAVSLPPPDVLLAALGSAANRFEALVRSLDTEQAIIPISNSSWTVADATAHVLTVVRRSFADRRRSSSAADLAELNATCLAELSERRPHALADQLATDVPRLLSLLASLPPDRPIPFHAGVRTTVQPVLAVFLGEFLVHGYDIAIALGQDWPIEAADADLLCRGVAPLLGAWLAPAAATAHLGYVLHTGADRPPIVLSVVDGQFNLELPAGMSPQALAVDPVELALAVIYKRRAVTDVRLSALAELFVSP